MSRINNQKNLNASVSYTFVKSEFFDVQTNRYIPSSWDSRSLLTWFFTYKNQKAWSFGAKWRLSGGLPYTPYDLEKSANIEAWDAQGRPYYYYTQIN